MQRSCEGYVFTGVCLSTGRCLVSGGSAPGGGVPGPEGSLVPGGIWSWRGAWSWGLPGPGGFGIPACTGRNPPTLPPTRERWLLLRTVRILLECILVLILLIIFVNKDLSSFSICFQISRDNETNVFQLISTTGG